MIIWNNNSCLMVSFRRNEWDAVHCIFMVVWWILCENEAIHKCFSIVPLNQYQAILWNYMCKTFVRKVSWWNQISRTTNVSSNTRKYRTRASSHPKESNQISLKTRFRSTPETKYGVSHIFGELKLSSCKRLIINFKPNWNLFDTSCEIKEKQLTTFCLLMRRTFICMAKVIIKIYTTSACRIRVLFKNNLFTPKK